MSRGLSFTVAILALVLVAAVSGKLMLRASHFHDDRCRGNASSDMYDVDRCLSFLDKDNHNVSTMLHCPRFRDRCVSLFFDAGPECTTPHDLYTAECNMCTPDHFFFACFEDQGRVQVMGDCNDDCSECAMTNLLEMNQCNDNTGHSVLLQSIHECEPLQCVYFFPDAGVNCSKPTDRVQAECDRCNDDGQGGFYKFACKPDGSIEGKAQCSDKDCMQCKIDIPVPPHSCVAYGNKTLWADGIGACGAVQVNFNDAECKDTKPHVQAFELEKCFGKDEAICVMAPDDKHAPKIMKPKMPQVRRQ